MSDLSPVQNVTKHLKLAHIDLKLSHQTTFRGYTVNVAEEKGLKENNRIYWWLAGVAIVGSGKGVNEGEIDGSGDLPEEMVVRDEAVEGEFVVALREQIGISPS